jgi:Flp pilus assembly secretin CpaC
VGGEVPIPSRDDPKAAVAFQKFGTELDLLAIVVDKERVRMELRMKVSEIDDARSIEVNGSRIPALRSRQCDTAVETKFGEPVILSGGVEERTETSNIGGKIVDQINEVALIVVATAELVDTITPSEAEPIKASRK